MKIAVVQVNTVWADRDANFAQTAPLISTAAENGATFVLLTEMFSTGFVVDQSEIGEPEGGLTSQFLTKMATQHNYNFQDKFLHHLQNRNNL
jgi:predicted amidohydrolase